MRRREKDKRQSTFAEATVDEESKKIKVEEVEGVEYVESPPGRACPERSEGGEGWVL
ncbi:MAG: hypothetical protein WCG82_10715 [Bacteroidota bacterium]